MKDISSLSHTKWECKYHIVFIPMYRRKALYYELRQYLGDIFRGLAAQRECQVEEGHLMLRVCFETYRNPLFPVRENEA